MESLKILWARDSQVKIFKKASGTMDKWGKDGGLSELHWSNPEWEQEQRQLSRNGKERDLNLSTELAVTGHWLREVGLV